MIKCVAKSTLNLQLQIGADPDQLPSERQVRVDDPTNPNPLLQV